MDAEQIVIGNSYTCSSPLLTEQFIAKVEKVYALSALVEVDTVKEEDQETIDDLNGRLVIPFSQITEN